MKADWLIDRQAEYNTILRTWHAQGPGHKCCTCIPGGLPILPTDVPAVPKEDRQREQGGK